MLLLLWGNSEGIQLYLHCCHQEIFCPEITVCLTESSFHFPRWNLGLKWSTFIPNVCWGCGTIHVFVCPSNFQECQKSEKAVLLFNFFHFKGVMSNIADCWVSSSRFSNTDRLRWHMVWTTYRVFKLPAPLLSDQQIGLCLLWAAVYIVFLLVNTLFCEFLNLTNAWKCAHVINLCSAAALIMEHMKQVGGWWVKLKYSASFCEQQTELQNALMDDI